MKSQSARSAKPQTQEEENFLSNSNSKTYFNAIDEAHELLEYDKDLEEKVPSCVVVGMQSVGKSAVLSRISGICFPQDSEVCTRIAIELRLRRAQSHDIPKLMTIKSGNSPSVQVDKSDDEAIGRALKNAQQKALGGREFEDKLSVKVEKEDKDLPEVTLIDLPGVFFAKDDSTQALQDQVNKMIKGRVKNEMALILHVIPLNQDTDTISTWRMVRDADGEKRTISVLTKADLALKDGKDIFGKRIKKILEDSKSSSCFIIHGAAKDSTEEERQLEEVSKLVEDLRLDGQIKVGVKELNKFIEGRMLEHIRQKIPEMRRMLRNELCYCEEELKNLSREPITPLQIVNKDKDVMIKCLNEVYVGSFQSEFRLLTENMTKQIFDIGMEPLDYPGKDTGKKVNEKLRKNMKKNCTPSDDLLKLHVLVLQVKEIGEVRRPMENIQFTDKLKELKVWLDKFAEPLRVILTKYISDIFKLFYQDVFRHSLEKGATEETKELMKNVASLIERDAISKAKDSMMAYADNLVQSVRENTYTSNYHYLEDTTKQLRTQQLSKVSVISSSYLADIQPHLDTVCDILAFLKTRKKVLPDAIQLHCKRALDDLYQETEKEIVDEMLKEDSLNTIKESNWKIKMRKTYIERESKVKSALKAIHLL